jgi:outer membrane protein assembly factor BamA
VEGVRLLVLLPLVACGAPQAARPTPIPAPCAAERVGQVIVTGTSRTAVPALAVLEGTLDDRDRTARIAQSAAESLHWRGYAQAKVDVTRAVGCFTDLHVAVTLGPKYKIAAIAFATTDDFPHAQRLAALEDTLGTVNTIGGVLIEYRLTRALSGLARRYRDAGWLDVEIGAPLTRYASNGEVRVSIPITAGARYRVSAVRALGANAQVRQRLLAEWGIEPGAWYDATAIRRALERARHSIDRRVKLRAQALEDRHEIELEAIVEAAR